MTASDREPTEIRWRNLRRWLKQTRRVDRRARRESPRPLGVRRLVHALWPNLRRPIFVVGAPRSGTSFLGDVVGVLPEVSYHYEPPITKAASRYVYDGRWSERRARIFYRQVYAWLMRRHWDGDLRFAEKTPQNCFIMPFLDRTFPEAQFVHIIRDGRDAALSYSKQPWLQAAALGSGRRESGGYPYGPVPRYWVEPDRRAEFEATTDLHRCAWAWRRFTEAALAHARTLPPERYHELRYETLVADPAGEGGRLLDFLGIDAAASRRRLTTALGGVRAASVGAWRRELGPDDLARIEREAGSLLRRLGYDGGPP